MNETIFFQEKIIFVIYLKINSRHYKHMKTVKFCFLTNKQNVLTDSPQNEERNLLMEYEGNNN